MSHAGNFTKRTITVGGDCKGARAVQQWRGDPTKIGVADGEAVSRVQLVGGKPRFVAERAGLKNLRRAA